MSDIQPSPFLNAPEFERTVAALIDRKSFTEASDLLSGTVVQLTKDTRFHARQIYLAGMDRLVERIGKGVLANPDALPGQPGARIPVIVATEIYPDGGHSRVVEELINIHGRGIVILTNYFGGTQRRKNVLPNGINGLPSVVLPEDSAANNIIRLNRLCNQLASEVYIVAHHHDVVAYAALSCAIDVPVFYIHHSDSKVSLGATMEALVHVDIAPNIHRFCTRALGREIDFWPQGVRDSGSKHFNWPLQAAASASSGHWSKYAWEGSIAYPAIIRTLLASGISQHFHIGMLPEEQRRNIAAELGTHGISPDRFHYIERVPSLWQCLLELPIHLFVGSAPTPGFRTCIEVQGAGIPFLPYRRPADALMDDKPLLNDMATDWASLEELAAAVAAVLANHQEAAACARRHYEANFHPELTRRAILRSIAAYEEKSANTAGGAQTRET